MAILYLSWVSSPKLGSIGLMPRWLAEWSDASRNDTFRTAIPFVALGMFSGLFFDLKNKSKKWWIISLILNGLIVFLAEVGQLLRPHRVFDFKDIIWGLIGSILGLYIAYLVMVFKHYKN